VNIHDRFLENPVISNLMKISPVGAELFHEDVQVTDGRMGGRKDKHGNVQ
jgi:hypothetical protein